MHVHAFECMCVYACVQYMHRSVIEVGKQEIISLISFRKEINGNYDEGILIC